MNDPTPPAWQLRNSEAPRLPRHGCFRAQASEVESLQELARGASLGLAPKPAQPREIPHDRLGRHPRLAEPPQGGVPVALGEPPSVLTHDEGNVQKSGRRPSERFVQQELPRRRHEQDVSAQHLADPRVSVIDDDSQLISGAAVAFLDDEITSDETLLTPEESVLEGHGVDIDTKTHRRILARRRLRFVERREAVAARARVDDRVLPGLVRRGGRFFDFLPTTNTRVGEPLVHQVRDGVRVDRQALRLKQRLTVEVEAEPGDVLEGLRGSIGLDPRSVDVLDPHPQRPARRPHGQPREQETPRVAEVEDSGGTRCQTTYRFLVVVRLSAE